MLLTKVALWSLSLGVLNTSAEMVLSNWTQGNALSSDSANVADNAQVWYNIFDILQGQQNWRRCPEALCGHSCDVISSMLSFRAYSSYWQHFCMLIRVMSSYTYLLLPQSTLLLLPQAISSSDLNSGTCGYGPLEHQWPFQGGAATSVNNTAIKGLPMNGCGTCWEVLCSTAAANEVHVTPRQLSCLPELDCFLGPRSMQLA